jgi:peptidoglycan hydrolase-like protein with peptidoglycan-binding domain
MPRTISLSINTKGEEVRVLHDALLQSGYQIPADEQNTTTFGNGTRSAILDFQLKNGLVATGIADEATLGKLGALGREQNLRKIAGEVITSAGTGAIGLLAVAVDKGLGKETALGSAITDSQGYYSISYGVEDLKKIGKQKADIEIRIVDKADQSTVYGKSSVHYNVDGDTVISIILDRASVNKSSEYSRLTAALNQHRGDMMLKDLQENEKRQDISYLANKAGWDARLVAMASLAEKYSLDTKALTEKQIPPALFYALFRAGLSTNKNDLYHTNSRALLRAWTKAIDQNIIDASLKTTINDYLPLFRNASASYILNNFKPAGISTLKELLSISMPDKMQLDFVTRSLNNAGNMDDFWETARKTYGNDVADNLLLDSKLGYLTINNAGLVKKLREAKHVNNTNGSPSDLIAKGLYKADAWNSLLEGVTIPPEIAGATPEEKKTNYARYMSSKLKLSYPTAVVAETVRNGELKVNGDDKTRTAMYEFFQKTQGRFEIGVTPIGKFLKGQDPSQPWVKELKKLHRIYQLSPSDKAMNTLQANNISSAYSIVQYSEDEFVKKFKGGFGSEADARRTYAKARHVHGMMLNMAVSYMTYKRNPMPYVLSGQPVQKKSAVDSPTMEDLFGSLDYCACSHGESVLGPSAYLVDILHFLDKNKYDEDGEVTEAYGPPSDPCKNPIDVLLSRRPDIQHIDLTPENAETPLPYIDLVNEILEYYVVNNKLNGFQGHNVNDITSAELMARPQFVIDQAYELLKGQMYPFNLPFDRRLETLRLCYDAIGVSLYDAMARLRVNDDLDTGGHANDPPYAWRDIYGEYLGISPAEYQALTNSGIYSLSTYFGETDGMAYGNLRNILLKASAIAEKTGVSYDDLIDIVKARFINPDSYLIPKLEKLGLSFVEIKQFKDGSMSQATLESKLPAGLDRSEYGGNVASWLIADYSKIMGLILFTAIDTTKSNLGLDKAELRYSLPDNNNNMLKEIDYWRLMRFIRLWKKLGWTIEETDKAITALYKAEFLPLPSDTTARQLARLDGGFKDLIIKLAHVKRIMETISLDRSSGLVKLLTLWSNIDTSGDKSLYKRIFLNPSILKLDSVFDENGYGEYLRNTAIDLGSHQPAVQAALNLTAEELSLIMSNAGLTAASALSPENISVIYRYSFLSKALKLSVQDFVTLKALSGINPFNALEDVDPSTLRFIRLAKTVGKSGIKVSALNYYILHEDATGKASPTADSILGLAMTIKAALDRIECENSASADPTGDTVKAKMALVYDNTVVDRFFGLLNGTTAYSTGYSQALPVLDQAVLDISESLAYDHYAKRLTFSGIMAKSTLARYDASNASQELKKAILRLYDLGQADYNDLFGKYGDLKALYDGYVASQKPEEQKMSDILDSFMPSLISKLKHLAVKQMLGPMLSVDQGIIDDLLENARAIHAAADITQPAIADFLNLEAYGAWAQYYYSGNTGGSPNKSEIVLNAIYYDPKNRPLPANTVSPGAAICGTWQFYMEVPDNGDYNFYVETDIGAKATLYIDENKIPLAVDTNGTWQNSTAIELKAGMLHQCKLEIDNVKNVAALKWESKGTARDIIPSRYLYPYTLVGYFRDSYIRLLKAISIFEQSGLNGKEIAYFTTALQVNNRGFLNALQVAQSQDLATAPALLDKIVYLMNYGELKESLKVKDETLALILESPDAVDENGDRLLLKVLGIDALTLKALQDRLAPGTAGLSDVYRLIRVYEAATAIKKFGVPAASLIAWTNCKPDVAVLSGVQNALRAKYDEKAWLDAIKPISDKLRCRQRNALVSYTLQLMKKSTDPSVNKIDTPDKLFEYFLIDTQMDPCMLSSRIVQATSTVQLFIDRCLMNLEQPDVVPSCIDASRWEWMKRYRVWEANRKIFLYPENWLEPELRIDKSSFYKDLEGELLQADITDDLAEKAMLGYLEKLDDVSKLEYCGMCVQDKKTGEKADKILHVFARTAGVKRKYHYRRFDYADETWSPWEKVDLDIEDNPILPAIWNGRLFLFWLNIIRKANTDGKIPDSQNGDSNPNASKSITGVSVNNLNNVATENIEIGLSWSEYYNNKWQPRKTSDLNKPILIAGLKPGVYDKMGRNALRVCAVVGDPSIAIYVNSPYNWIIYDHRYFILRNKHSTPEPGNWGIYKSIYGESREFTHDDNYLNNDHMTLDIEYSKDGEHTFKHSILKNEYLEYEIVQEKMNPDPFYSTDVEAPFIYQNATDVFFVLPERSIKTVPVHLDPPGDDTGIDIRLPHIDPLAPIWEKPWDIWQDINNPIFENVAGNPVESTPVNEKNGSYVNTAVQNAKEVDYGGVAIGSEGSQYANNYSSTTHAGTVEKVNANAARQARRL